MCVEIVSKKGFYNGYCGQSTKCSREWRCRNFNNAMVRDCHNQRTIGTMTFEMLHKTKDLWRRTRVDVPIDNGRSMLDEIRNNERRR